MGIQFNQIDNLQSTFDDVSGALQDQITPATGQIYSIRSGNIGFEGHKYFNGNVDISGGFVSLAYRSPGPLPLPETADNGEAQFCLHG